MYDVCIAFDRSVFDESDDFDRGVLHESDSLGGAEDLRWPGYPPRCGLFWCVQPHLVSVCTDLQSRFARQRCYPSTARCDALTNEGSWPLGETESGATGHRSAASLCDLSRGEPSA